MFLRKGAVTRRVKKLKTDEKMGAEQKSVIVTRKWGRENGDEKMGTITDFCSSPIFSAVFNFFTRRVTGA